jgi:type IV secretion system protein VirD4
VTRWDAIKTKFLLLSKGEKLIFAFIVSFIVSLLPAGFFAAFMVGEWSAGLLRMLKLSVTTSYGLAIALIFAFALTFVAAMVFRKNMDLNGAKEIDDRGMITSNAGTYGTAEWMSEAEAKQVYEVGPVEKVTGTILGQFTQEGEEVIALPFEPTGNRNLILIGPPGSGKSFGYVRTAVFQSIVRGESVVVTDPKGEIHNDMRKLLEANGYKVKVFNLINLDLSNAWDCVQEIYDPITGNIDDQRVITFCKTVITNTGGGAGGDPFWESSEENLFRVAVSYCAFMRETTLIKIYERRTKELLTQLPFITEEDGDKLIEIVKNPESAMFDRRKVVEYLAENFYGKEEGSKKLQSWEDDAPTCNISDIYNALLHNDLNSWEDNFKNVPLNHPAASAWAVFKGMGERVQPNIVGGLNTRLQLFMTYKVRRVISNDDIRLANIGAEKTALFLIISDDNASMQLLSSLLLSFLFKDLKEAFDAVGGEGRIPVNVVADELANTGVWPNFEKTIATARSRKIAVSLILQSLPQLTQLYGEENAETIIGCCNTMLVLGCNDKYTAEYISDKSGIVTIRAKSVSDSRASTIGLRGAMQGYSLSEGDGKRNLMNPDEVQHLGKEEILIMTNGQNLLKAKRFGFIHHPLFTDPHFVPTKWAELPRTVDLYPNARKHDALESLVGDIQKQKEVNTSIAQKRTEEKMNPHNSRLSKEDLLGGNKKPEKENAFTKKSAKSKK